MKTNQNSTANAVTENAVLIIGLTEQLTKFGISVKEVIAAICNSDVDSVTVDSIFENYDFCNHINCLHDGINLVLRNAIANRL